MKTQEESQPVRPLEEFTDILKKWTNGDHGSLHQLIDVAYDQLHNIASHVLAGKGSPSTLHTTEVLHELYLRLRENESRNIEFENRYQFFGFAGQLMRRVLADYARQRLALKRGAGQTHISHEDVRALPHRKDLHPDKLVDLDRALEKLEEIDPRQCRMVELRFFVGLKVEEMAKALSLSPTTVKREWRTARLWLAHELSLRAEAEGKLLQAKPRR